MVEGFVFSVENLLELGSGLVPGLWRTLELGAEKAVAVDLRRQLVFVWVEVEVGGEKTNSANAVRSIQKRL